jgi:hypothetical protein
MRLMPAATGVAPALRAEYVMGNDPEVLADVLSAVDQEEALELQLRGYDGVVIATESIAIIDTHYVLSIPDCDVPREDLPEPLDPAEEAELEAMIEEWIADLDVDEPWRQTEEEVEFPRYQIQVQLVDRDDAVYQ